MAIELPPDARRRLAEDDVAWLTTVTDTGLPAPNPIWLVADGDDIVIYSEPSARKVHNIQQRPKVTLHFNSDPHGGDIVIVSGTATVTHDRKPSHQAGYVDKYEAAITGELDTTVEAIDATYNTEIRIAPTGVRLTPPA